MIDIYNDITELVGNTPLLEFRQLTKGIGTSAKVIGKLEFFNPSGSVKDRIAKQMITEAEKTNRLTKGDKVIEGTSGNTGIGIAAISAARGYQSIIVMPDNMSKERIAILKAYGAEIVLTPGEKNMAGTGEKIAEIIEEYPNIFQTEQSANLANPASHYQTTGPEIWRDTEGKIDIFIVATGTGGTISGAGKYLREKNPAIEIVAVEPAGCPVLSGGEAGFHKIQGIGGGMIPPVCNQEIYDEVIPVTDKDAYETAVKCGRIEGVLIGISSGAALFAAIQVAKRKENRGKTIVVIIADNGERYLSSDLYE
ncbi:cysteine synthase A [Enterococcus olivae]